jgi:hypothetical protein
MQANPMTPFVQQSQDAVQVILGAQAIYRGLMRFVDAVWATVLLFVAGIPAIGIFWLLLRWIRHKLAKSLRKEVSVTDSNYTQLRKEYDSLDKNREKLESLQQIDIKHQPWLLRGIFSQIKAINRFNELRLQKLAQAFQTLDPIPTSADGTLRPIKESELWRQRNKAYDYLM